MTFQPGDVVFLKSGGQSMTVAAITDENVECIWLGEEGDLFRQAIPAVALTSPATSRRKTRKKKRRMSADCRAIAPGRIRVSILRVRAANREMRWRERRQQRNLDCAPRYRNPPQINAINPARAE